MADTQRPSADPAYTVASPEQQRLFDAAEDMLAALEELVKRCPFVPVEGGVQATISMEQIARANAAVAKAKGDG